MSIEIITGFDGSSPHSDAGVKQEEENKFTVYPSWRKVPGIDEESIGNGSRFYIRINNDSAKNTEVFITADWETPKRLEHHDYGFIRHESEDEWTQVAGIHNKKTKIDYQFEVKPGITELGLVPAYNVEKLTGFLDKIIKKGLKVESIGKSGEERDLNLISIPSENKNASNFFIQARDHAYETAGSYCVEGIIDSLCGESRVAEHLRSKFNFYIMPMTNPDGVFNGLSRLSHETGFNNDRLYWNNGPGPEGETLIKTLDHIQPAVYMNIHNYAMKFIDGLLTCESSDFVKKIIKYLPADHEHHKEWFIVTDEEWCKKNNYKEYPKSCWGGKNYCKNNFDSISIIFEFPWFSRNTTLMKERGVKALTALGLTAIEELKI
jgi:hypothetical protein